MQPSGAHTHPDGGGGAAVAVLVLFIAVALAFLALFLLGWRLLARLAPLARSEPPACSVQNSRPKFPALR